MSRLVVSAVRGTRRSWLTWEATLTTSRWAPLAAAFSAAFTVSRLRWRRSSTDETLSARVRSVCSWTGVRSLAALSNTHSRAHDGAARRVDGGRGVEVQRHHAAVDEGAGAEAASWRVSGTTTTSSVAMRCWHIVSAGVGRQRVDAGGDEVVELAVVGHGHRGDLDVAHVVQQVDELLDVGVLRAAEDGARRRPLRVDLMPGPGRLHRRHRPRVLRLHSRLHDCHPGKLRSTQGVRPLGHP